MDQAPIPDKVKRFILLAIPSVPYLEAILLLRDAGDNKLWTRQEISQRLYLSDSAGEALLDELLAGGALAADLNESTRYRYQPKTEELREMLDLVATIYPKNLVGVTNLIHSKVNKKAQLFANAFLLRRDK